MEYLACLATQVTLDLQVWMGSRVPWASWV